MNALIAVGIGFVLGSIPFGYLLVRLRDGGDVRNVGSGNIGATNVGRVLGRGGALVTLLADAAKGGGAVVAAGVIAPGSLWAPAGAGLAAILGHCYTPWLGGRGGKGVATMFGAFLTLAPAAAGAAAVCFGGAVLLTRHVSAASLAAAVGLVVATVVSGNPQPTVLAAAATAALIFLRHRANIGRLIAGTEASIDREKS